MSTSKGTSNACAVSCRLARTLTYLTRQQGPLFGGNALDATDAAFAPKLYHATVALPHFKVGVP